MGLLKKYVMHRRGGQLKCRLTYWLNRRLYTARNALRLHKRNRTPPNSWKPKPSGASGSVRAERYFRADMQVCPYRWLSLIQWRKRLRLSDGSTFSTARLSSAEPPQPPSGFA